MFTKFIEAFKNTSYYQKLFESHEILAIHIMGSMCVGITDERSDYDIAIFTLGGEHIDVSEYEYLMYNGKKVHWYYFPIESLFDLQYGGELKILCPIQLRNIREDLVIYENPKYVDMLHSIYKIKDKISTMAMYRFFEAQQDYIDGVLNEGRVLAKHHTKYLYHLCLASYYLTGEEIDKDFLRKLKRIRWQPVPDEYKNLAVERLKIYKNYIEQNPLDVDCILKKLYDDTALSGTEDVYVY